MVEICDLLSEEVEGSLEPSCSIAVCEMVMPVSKPTFKGLNAQKSMTYSSSPSMRHGQSRAQRLDH